jgi:hypothetical protein
VPGRFLVRPTGHETLYETSLKVSVDRALLGTRKSDFRAWNTTAATFNHVRQLIQAKLRKC